MGIVRSYFSRTLLICMILLPCFVSADDTLWNMPYARPSKYNNSAYFSSDVITYLSADPGYFKRRLTSGWTFYKANYLMSTGLIMQMSGQGVNTTTAVSEGIGYGLLLALINNDQTTFNKIFNGANQYMWNSSNSHNSYFNWKIVNGAVSGSGAATDAELDICMALIFADKLQKNSAVTKWTAYNSGGVTYASRATQMLQSIHTNMTQNNYLLPGDNFGGTGLSNLNPSYFATGFMRAFDQFQTTYQFTPVATTCYAVLKSRSAQYAKGQAPDWCTNTGGQASTLPSGENYAGLGMTNDAIRVPWRICMDALWFDNADAKAFCSNSRNTLTNYTQSASNALALKPQFTEYTSSQTPVPSTEATPGLCHFAAMWLCGAIGSKDATYAKQCINGTWLQNIAGQTDCFGDRSMSDQYYYYNQSLAMLGFAAITGMFPNVLADTIKAVNTEDVPQKAAPVGLFRIRVLPGGIGFSFGGSNLAKGRISVALYDVKGKRALSRSLDAGAPLFMPVDKASLGAGLYMVKATVREGTSKTMEYLDRVNWK